ncbi:hypothetical protein EGW08_009197, partial [Elysia chlorotica]
FLTSTKNNLSSPFILSKVSFSHSPTHSPLELGSLSLNHYLLFGLKTSSDICFHIQIYFLSNKSCQVSLGILLLVSYLLCDQMSCKRQPQYRVHQRTMFHSWKKRCWVES